MIVGLRIDVDTFRGTRLGVPNLCKLLAAHSTTASFFFSVGPDNMGRHLWRLLRPSFLWKMLRTNATSLYGWDILLKGTFWPGPLIGEKLAPVIRAAAEDGHEVGLHAWDHQAWQTQIDSMWIDSIYTSISKGVDLLTELLGETPTCSAVPGWKCNDLVLKEKTKFPFRYNSDCRGHTLFYPVIDGQSIEQPQIPVTMPTYDEVIGRNGVSDANYNEYILSHVRPDALNVLTVHAEVEGIVKAEMFRDFLEMARTRGISFVPLGQLLDGSEAIESDSIIAHEIPGRQGWVACQKHGSESSQVNEN
jgi:undecaprenyl phosphate-alpha-L-ara4FN deformylase